MQLEVEVEIIMAHQNPMQMNLITLEMVELENQVDLLDQIQEQVELAVQV
jgi:hypothetical protein